MKNKEDHSDSGSLDLYWERFCRLQTAGTDYKHSSIETHSLGFLGDDLGKVCTAKVDSDLKLNYTTFTAGRQSVCRCCRFVARTTKLQRQNKLKFEKQIRWWEKGVKFC